MACRRKTDRGIVHGDQSCPHPAALSASRREGCAYAIVARESRVQHATAAVPVRQLLESTVGRLAIGRRSAARRGGPQEYVEKKLFSARKSRIVNMTNAISNGNREMHECTPLAPGNSE